MRTATATVLALVLGLTPAVAAAQRPDFSGAWVVDPSRSTLGAAVVSVGRWAMRIQHREPGFRCVIVRTTARRSDSVDLALTTDGQEIVSALGKDRLVHSLVWEGDTLVWTTRVSSLRGDAISTVRYFLRDAGQTLEAREQHRGPAFQYDNVWVYARLEPWPP